jgi:hypothetical protein
LEIRDILAARIRMVDPYLWRIQMQIRVAQKHTDPDLDPDADSEHWYIYIIFRRWKVIKKLQNSTNQGFSYYSIFDWWRKDPEPDQYLWLMDPDADPGGPKAYGYGSASKLNERIYAYLIQKTLTWDGFHLKSWTKTIQLFKIQVSNKNIFWFGLYWKSYGHSAHTVPILAKLILRILVTYRTQF